MKTTPPIGRVVATEQNPTTTGNLRFWLTQGIDLKPFDFVRIIPPESSSESIGDFYAIIDEIFQVSDEVSPLSNFISSDFGDSSQKPRVGRVVTTYADATVLYNTKDIEMPVPHGARVYWPDEHGVRRALGIDDYNRKTPAGFITMSGPEKKSITINVDVDADYLLGPEGAHLNISGISGLATKTSYAMFLMSAIQQQQSIDMDPRDNRTSFVILNVKSSDLLHVHEKAPDLSDKTRSEWQKCGLEARPLNEVTYYYPFSPNAPAKAQTYLEPSAVDDNVNSGCGFRYFYDVDSFLERLLLLFEDLDDPNSTLVSCAEYCMENFGKATSWNTLNHEIKEWARETPDKKIPVVSWRRFARLFRQRTRNRVFTERSRFADKYCQVNLADRLKQLKPGHVAVVDIAQLPDYLQSFVVADIISALREARTGEVNEDEPDAVADGRTFVLFADELNKFAPRQSGKRSLVRYLREVSERGRSEGLILFGAEQFRTSVDERVTGNSSTHVFGRTTAVEAGKDPEIRARPQSKRVPFLRKGELLVSHTRFSSGTLKLRFPRNAYRPG